MPFKPSYLPSYFSIDDILVTQEKFPAKFITDVLRLGFINPANNNENMKSGTPLEIPQWLAHHFLSKRPALTEIEFPKIYKEAYREILQADANAVDLHKLNLHFYDFGLYVAFLDDRGLIRETLIDTFKTRFRQVMDLADNVVTDPSAMQKFDSLEKRLFYEGQKAREELNEWLFLSNAQIMPADMVLNHKKRKRAENDHL